MIRQPIRDLHSPNGGIGARAFDLIVDDCGKAYLETKRDKKQFLKIAWEDVEYQVKAVLGSQNK